MHHGTILFDTDASVLSSALNPSKLKMQSKGIKSVRARVTNVIDYINEKITIEQFKNGLKEQFLKDCDSYEFTEKDINSIQKLVCEKYSTYEWNIGRSPKGQNTFTKKFDFGIFTFIFDTKEGLIDNAVIQGDFFEKLSVKEFAKTLNGIKFTKSELEKAFNSVGEYISGANGKEIVDRLFE